jgi:hypothetical protein
MTTARNTSGNENCSMHPVDSLFYVLGRCWITLGPQHIPNSTSLCPICFAQHCPLATYILGQMLAIVFILGVITSTLWSLQNFRAFLWCANQRHSLQKKKKRTWKAYPQTNLFIKEPRLFLVLRSYKPWCPILCSWYNCKALMSRSTPRWFGSIYTYDARVMDY